MPSDIDYKLMAYARDPERYAHLKPEIDEEIEKEQEENNVR